MLGLLALAAYSFDILFSDNLHVRQDTYAHWITITSDAIRSFPILDPTGEPSFHYSSADGPQPSMQSVRYTSGAGVNELSIAIASHMEAKGFRMEEQMYVREYEQIHITMEVNPDASVAVTATLSSH